jgi:hypothetical protein
MDNCGRIKELLVLHAEGALEAAENDEVRRHLAICAACKREAGEIEQIRRLLADPEVFAPNSDLTWQLLPGTIAARAQTARGVSRWLPANAGSLAWTLSMAAVLVLAFGSVWLINRPQHEPQAVPAAEAPGNAAFLGKMQVAYAREATSQYLSECQDLLLTLMRAGKNCDGNNYDVSFEVERARRLIQRKQMLDSELKSPDVASAKILCDELENFLVHLSTSDRCESPEKMRRMESYIQREQLLLRINLLQSELS